MSEYVLLPNEKAYSSSSTIGIWPLAATTAPTMGRPLRRDTSRDRAAERQRRPRDPCVQTSGLRGVPFLLLRDASSGQIGHMALLRAYPNFGL